jgi:hypothetical protein
MQIPKDAMMLRSGPVTLEKVLQYGSEKNRVVQ